MGKAETLAQAHHDQMIADTGVRPGPDVPPDGTRGPYDDFARLAGAGSMPIGHLVPDPDQPRTEWDEADLDRLAASIKQKGMLQPIRVRWNAELGKHVVTVGGRRLKAAQLAGLSHVPCIVVEGEISDADILAEQLVENEHRAGLSALDEARAFQKYMQLTGCSAKELSQLLHISPQSVGRALSLLSLPAEVQSQVATGAITPTAGAAIAKLKNNPEVAKRVAAKAAETKAPVAEIEKQVRQRQGTPAKASQQQQPFVQFKIARGTRVVIHGRLTGREVLEALRAAVAMAEAELEQGEGEWEDDADTPEYQH